MSDREAQRAAEFLAAHALLLLGLGLLLAVAALAAVAAAVTHVRRYWPAIDSAIGAALSYGRRFAVVDRALARLGAWAPSAYLAIHLALGLVVTAAAAVFFVIAEDVVGKGEIVAFDVAFAQALRNRVTPGWERFFTVVSWLGGGWVTMAATVVVAIHMLRSGKRLLAGGWAAAQAGGGLLNALLKETFERTRPSFADPVLAASSWSFPSGHAMGTFIFVGLGCYLLLRHARSWTTAGALAAVALAWCVAVAFSRLYLGVHFASDVVAGIVAGAAWVAVCASAFEVVRRVAVRRRAGPARE